MASKNFLVDVTFEMNEKLLLTGLYLMLRIEIANENGMGTTAIAFNSGDGYEALRHLTSQS